jgi:trehalose-phosphatase
MGFGDTGTTRTGANGEHVIKVVQSVQQRAGGRRLLLLSDFDGTLCEFSPDPAAVWLSPVRRGLLAALAERPDVTIGLVSGRRIADLRRRTGLGNRVYYAGLHGLEIEGKGATFVHDRLSEAVERIRALVRRLAPRIEGLPGVFLEDKGVTVALHVRRAEPDVRRIAEHTFEQVVRFDVADGVLRIMPGSFVYELLPNIAWNKGHALRWIAAHVERRERQRPLVVYVGDDITDEDAFQAIADNGVTVVVGERASSAAFRLPDPPSVEALLLGLHGAVVDAAMRRPS